MGFVRLSVIMLVGLTTVGFAGGWAMNEWAEKQITPAHENNPDIRRWEWDIELDHWNGDHDAYGTDPACPLTARFAIRAAWQALNFLPDPPEGSVHTPRPVTAAAHLLTAIGRMQPAYLAGKVGKDTWLEINALLASVLERIGPAEWTASRAVYEQVWAMLPASGPRSARVALILGNLNHGLGQQEAALHWWKTSAGLCTGNPMSDDPAEWIPTEIPSSPACQRTVASVLVAVSAHLAASGEYKKAEQFELASLSFLRSIRPSSLSTGETSPAEALHYLYLLQCSSLLSIHIAQVLHGRKRPVSESLAWLQTAVTSSQKIVSSTTMQNLQPTDGDHPCSLPLPPPITSSRGMTKMATQAVADATSSATEALNLASLLLEGTDPAAAARNLETALWWSSISTKGGLQASSGVLEAKWKDYNQRLQKMQQTRSQSI
ncbi:hypothetical protein DL96DRAFT_1521132 [Flagelloscypha sp. PMI_526]|nr:hypothetical protein DL96DRAFT_1521132 [Flagelloscypha sp. PMI_526]